MKSFNVEIAQASQKNHGGFGTPYVAVTSLVSSMVILVILPVKTQ
jgi:hypothetical protein